MTIIIDNGLEVNDIQYRDLIELVKNKEEINVYTCHRYSGLKHKYLIGVGRIQSLTYGFNNGRDCIIHFELDHVDEALYQRHKYNISTASNIGITHNYDNRTSIIFVYEYSHHAPDD